jgi:hypothetical protein
MAQFIEVELEHLATSYRSHPIYPRNGRYLPHLRFSPDGEYLGVRFLDGPAVLARGESGRALLQLVYLETGVDYSALTPGTQFEVQEGPHTVARGHVLRRWTGPEIEPRDVAT